MFSNMTRFESLLEAVPDALVGMDQKGVIRFVNRQTESLFGYDRDELVGRPIKTLVPESLWQIYSEHRENYFADPRARSTGLDLQLTGRHRDGTEFPVNISLSHIDTGDVLLVITAVADVTKQRQAVKNAQLITAIVKYSSDAIIGNTSRASSRAGTRPPRGCTATPAWRSSAGPRPSCFPMIEPTRSTPSWRRSGPARLSRGSRRCVFERTERWSQSRSPSHRSATRRAFEVAQRLAAIVESSDDAIIARTLEGFITSWNPAAEAMFGYSGAEVIGKSADLLIPEDRIDEMIAILAKVSAGQHVDRLQSIRVRKDATVFPVSLTVSPIRDAGGAIVGASVTGRDMTELEHAAQYARSLIEAGLDPLVTISPEGKITDVNEATVAATGVPREALIGTDFFDYFTDPDKAKECHQLVFAQGSVSDYPLTLLHRDGTLTDVLYDASLYRDFNGTVLGVFAVARDASMLRQHQQLNVQLQEALKSRVVIEQAKGITAQRHGVTIDQAYQRIRAHARNNNASLRTVAEAIVEVGLQV